MNTTVPNPRKRASMMLSRVLEKKQLLEDVLDEGLKSLEPRDRALARAITSTTLRHLGILDTLIDRMLERPLPKAAMNVRNALRIGLAQVLFMEVANHAAVHDTVELIPANSKFRGLVNALLRRADRQGDKLLARMNTKRANTPDWLWQSWINAYGKENASAIAKAHQFEAPLDINVKSEATAWALKLDAVLLPTEHLRLIDAKSVPELEGFDEGEWWVQDYAASLPAKLFGDLTGKRVLDVCAAPGGKTIQLALKGGNVTALDRSAARLKRLTENMERLGLNVEVKAADATGFVPANPFDAILLDAPCSSTGTIRRHPDVAWLKTQKDVEKLAGLQARLLDAAAGQLAPGGTLVYSTCSLQPEEGEGQIAAFLARHPEFSLLPAKSEEFEGLEEVISEEGYLRALPCHYGKAENPKERGMDGFFAARLIKSS
ncbi:16S rRNA (cytosine(967)-C(5))-methyltransferase RsmB [Sneathiella sp. P13V-1]|uniref:16S rRNA (cytosine(967)-C(5))-methyltransferase RsmB n=1 Tax=Sneathiella sp. P13V-1 TaxID=2697366 RepID=UPI00187BA06E|nr:16S rRNA (cytosine(967)-C(5))-methyltransferase RsmB [Sneathiella sp. P13V-1]MBE7636238.1 16S rRNA (cytosine(967)-C(5))-methyltransferase RsmB [Sneathiella sp. P13V-1]